jgi:hypothetical protein
LKDGDTVHPPDQTFRPKFMGIIGRGFSGYSSAAECRTFEQKMRIPAKINLAPRSARNPSSSFELICGRVQSFGEKYFAS